MDEVDDLGRIQPTLAEVMRARGAVPLSYAIMAAAYPDLFEQRGGGRERARAAGETPRNCL